MDGPIINISFIFIVVGSVSYFIIRVSKAIPSPFNVSVRPCKSAKLSNFAKAGALINLKLSTVRTAEEFLSSNFDI